MGTAPRPRGGQGGPAWSPAAAPPAARRAGAWPATGHWSGSWRPASARTSPTSWPGAGRWLDREVQEGDLDGVWLVHAVTGDPDRCAVCRWSPPRAGSEGAGAASGGRGRRTRRPRVTARPGWSSGGFQDHADRPPGPPCGTARPHPVRRRARPCARPRASGRRGACRARGRAGRLTGHFRPRSGRCSSGGGPGRADLITTRGPGPLSEADVVVADRLGPGTARRLYPGVGVIDVGKAPGPTRSPRGDQPDPRRAARARPDRGPAQGRRPVPVRARRRGAGPLRRRGVPVEGRARGQLPAAGAGRRAGIPLTHRRDRRSPCTSPTAIRPLRSRRRVRRRRRGHPRPADGGRLLPEHVTRLLDAGADPGTPVAIVESATLPTQRVTRAPLVTVAEAAAARPSGPPPSSSWGPWTRSTCSEVPREPPPGAGVRGCSCSSRPTAAPATRLRPVPPRGECAPRPRTQHRPARARRAALLDAKACSRLRRRRGNDDGIGSAGGSRPRTPRASPTSWCRCSRRADRRPGAEEPGEQCRRPGLPQADWVAEFRDLTESSDLLVAEGCEPGTDRVPRRAAPTASTSAPAAGTIIASLVACTAGAAARPCRPRPALPRGRGRRRWRTRRLRHLPPSAQPPAVPRRRRGITDRLPGPVRLRGAWSPRPWARSPPDRCSPGGVTPLVPERGRLGAGPPPGRALRERPDVGRHHGCGAAAGPPHGRPPR